MAIEKTRLGLSLALRAGVSVLALGLATTQSHAASADGASDADSELVATNQQEVVVTARKQTERLQDVPLAITAFSLGQLKEAGITDLYTLAQQTPGLTAQSIGGTYQAPVIRGLAQVDQTGVIGNVGVFIDGVYINNRDGLDFGFLDLNRIEVLKGPQNALYGQSTFSGAIDYVTKLPNVHNYDGYAIGDFGDYGLASGQASVNIPIADIAAIRLSGGRDTFDGTIKNLETGGYAGGYAVSTYSVSGLFQPTPDVRVRAFYTRTDTNDGQVPYAYLPTSANTCGDLVAGPNGNRYSLYCGKLPVPTTVSLEASPASGLRGFNALGYVTGDWDLKFATLTGTIGYTNAAFAQLNDVTGSATAYTLPLFPGSIYSKQQYLQAVQPASHETSYDLRLVSPTGGRFNWSLGVYQYQSYIESNLAVYDTLIGSRNPSYLAFGKNGIDADSGNSVYGSFGWNITDKLNVRAEGRLEADDQKFAVPDTTTTGRTKSKYFVPRVTVSYRLNSDLNFYASAARGLKDGGFNANAVGLPQFTFGPERNWTYEAGVKADLFNHKLVVDADIYYIDWAGIQVQSNIPSSTISVTVNDKGATSYGLEWDSTYNFTPNLWARLGFTVLNPTYDSGTIDGEVLAPCGAEPGTTFITNGCSPNVGGKQLARTSDAQVSLSGQYTLPKLVGPFDAYIRGDYSYQAGIHYFSLANDTQGDISLVNARVGLTKDHLEFALWVKNLLDSEYLARATETQSGADGTGVEATRVYPGQRRTFGVEGIYKF